MSRVNDFGPGDLRLLQELHISEQEARRQLDLLRHAPRPFRLLRPCRIGDGIQQIPPQERKRLAEPFRRAAAAGRFAKFVPASGAASRMFKNLLALLAERPFPEPPTLHRRAADGEPSARDCLRLAAHLSELPFAGELETALEQSSTSLETVLARHDFQLLLETVLTSRGLALAELPKGLLPFHRYPQGSRTAFEEHLVEAVSYVADERGACRLHFTVPPHQQKTFAALSAKAGAALRRSHGARFEVSFSTQSRATDTLAVDLADRPLRHPDGSLLLRPGGHGALLQNLSRLGGDLVFIKNIDNILPESRQGLAAEWKTVLGGRLVEIQKEVFDLLESLQDPRVSAKTLVRGLELVEQDFGCTDTAELRHVEAEQQRQFLIRRLDRPLRVCGVIPRKGDPGGAPFWVKGSDGRVSIQIVETAEVAPEPEQQHLFETSTHFNPVDVACGLRNWRGEAFRLERFVDPQAVFLARKSHGGMEIKALERPGLWNGGMAHWNTHLVEVPAATFAPVKTIFDLLSPEHQLVPP